MLRSTALLLLVLAIANVGKPAWAQGGQTQIEGETARTLREFDGRVIVLGTVRQPPLASMLARDVEARLRMANRADRLAWNGVRSKADWEGLRDRGLKALRESLGQFPAVPNDLRARTTRTLEGDGYRVDNLAFVSRPGMVVAANLYRPAKPAASMPGMILCHSHQSTKHNGWRQDMAMTWARAGCVVLVPDHLGHGERRQHPFGDEPPHDYHFRYDLGIQLHLVGESLMGVFAWDLMRGVDLLLAQKGVDPQRIIIISEPAGGGDVAAVTAALDPRITGIMVQNFGGPEPETPYPLPKDAEESFDYSGGGSWESTRNLRLSARDGFMPWQIVASAAPRKLIYFHEFYWDRERDPVWKRLERVYALEGAADSLVGLAGHGFVVGSSPENSHWLPVNRELLYPTLERWFAVPNPGKEYSQRRPEQELHCLTPDVARELGAQPLHAWAAKLGSARTSAAREARAKLGPAERRERLRGEWTRLLGESAPGEQGVLGHKPPPERKRYFTAERIHLSPEPGIVVPILLLLPAAPDGSCIPVVIGVAHQGKQAFLRERAAEIAQLLAAGVAVCLPDVRGTGETSPGEDRERRSAATSISASEWMLGQSLLGGRLRDLRAVMNHLRARPDIDARRFALWGDSFAKANRHDANFQVPYTADKRPALSEPLGGLLALLGALFEDDVQAVFVQGGLCDYQSLLEDSFCYLPHDAVVPGVLRVGDLSDLAGAVSPRPLWLAALVDGHNRGVAQEQLDRIYATTRQAYTSAGASSQFLLGSQPQMAPAAQWLKAQLPPGAPAR